MKNRILNAINEGIKNALLQFDDDIKFSKSNLKTYSDISTEEALKILALEKCRLNEKVWECHDKNGNIAYRIGGQWSGALKAIGYCCATANMMPDGKPRFCFNEELEEKYKWIYSKDAVNIQIANRVNSKEDLKGYENTKSMLNNILDVDRELENIFSKCEELGSYIYVPSIGEIISCKNYINTGIGKYWSSTIGKWNKNEYVRSAYVFDSKLESIYATNISFDYKLYPFIHIDTENLVISK